LRIADTGDRKVGADRLDRACWDFHEQFDSFLDHRSNEAVTLGREEKRSEIKKRLVKWGRVASRGYMKKKTPDSALPKGLKTWMLQEAQAAEYKPVEMSVRAAKDQLSSLLERAAQGEEIVITSDGKPKAMIVRYRPVITGQPARSMALLRRSMPMTPDSTGPIREARDGRY
jgi:prevent-host-death family protein